MIEGIGGIGDGECIEQAQDVVDDAGCGGVSLVELDGSLWSIYLAHFRRYQTIGGQAAGPTTPQDGS